MAAFSKDIDVLLREPDLFGPLHLPSQVRVSGSGATIAGTTLTAAGADFVSAGVEAGHVVHVESDDGGIDAGLEVVAVPSATTLTVSVLRPDPTGAAIAPVAGSDLAFRVCSFEPQAVEAAFELTQALGVRPGDPLSDITVSDIVDTEGLRRASVLRVIGLVYARWATSPAGSVYWRKVELYAAEYERTKDRCRVGVDLGADGVSDIAKAPGSSRLRRA